jgi:Fur family transcriptional regulator, ferric uptake regulator
MKKITRNTKAKAEILKFIIEANRAVSHTDIQKSLGGICDRVTIYRVLERLTDEKSVHRIVNVDGVINYAPCHSCSSHHTHNHVHFSCITCNELSCLENNEISLSLPEGYFFKEAFLTVSGICKNCSSHG